jgi:hypothetical protein
LLFYRHIAENLDAKAAAARNAAPQRVHSGKTGTAVGEEHAFLRSTENFAKRTGIFAGFEYNIRDSSNLK